IKDEPEASENRDVGRGALRPCFICGALKPPGQYLRRIPAAARTARLARFASPRRAPMTRLLPLSLLLFALPLAAQPAQELTLDRIMDNPDWIGPPVEQAWWSWDGSRAFYSLKRE